MDATAVNDVGGLPELGAAAVCAAEPVRDELLAEAVKELEGGEVRAGRDLDQLSEAVPDLRYRQSSEEGEVEEGVDRSVVGAETVLVLAVVDGDLDGYRGVNEANDRCGDADEIGCSAVGCARISVVVLVVVVGYYIYKYICSISTDLPSNVGGKPAPDHKHGFLADNAKIRKCIADGQKRIHVLCLLSDLRFVDNQSNTVGLEILLHLRSVKRTDVDVCHGQASAPFLIHVCELRILDVENTVEKGEIIGDFFIALDMEASARLGHSGREFRHGFKGTKEGNQSAAIERGGGREKLLKPRRS